MLRVRKKKKNTRRTDELLKMPTTVTACSDGDTTDGDSTEKVLSIPPLRSLANNNNNTTPSSSTPTTILPGRQGGGGFASALGSGGSIGRAASQQQHLYLQSGSGSQSITTGISSRTPSYGIPTFDAINTVSRTQFDSNSESSSSDSGSGSCNTDSEGGRNGESSSRRRPIKIFPQQDFKYEALVDGVLRDRALIDG
eukprot:Rmarinus@m.15949